MSAKIGFGAKIQAEVTTPGTFADIADVVDIKPFGRKADVIDATSHSSTGGIREKLPGLIDNGDVTFELNFDNNNAGHSWLIDNIGTLKSLRVQFPGTGSRKQAAFSAVLSDFSPGVPHDGKMTASVAAAISGAITWSA